MTMADVRSAAPDVVEMLFGGMRIRYDERVLTPRSWTLLQSRWAAELLKSLPAGRVLELCCGAGQIGLAAVVDTTRRIVCVDRDPVAAGYAAENAARAGMAVRTDVRESVLEEAVGDGERFVLVIADPPWVASEDTGRFPEDPLTAIDGGPDGLDVARLCLRVAAEHLMSDGVALVQLGTVEQAESLRPHAGDLGLELREIRVGERGVVVLFARGR
jgi:methylase of polypeptide subunit release factors